MRKQFTCIGCPLGCRLRAEVLDGRVYDIQGNRCPNGEDYARQEALDPRRILTYVLPVIGAKCPLSVRTSAPVPKARLQELVDLLREIRVRRPVRRGAIIVKNALNTGADIIATREIP